jgi:hypothetical protein
VGGAVSGETAKRMRITGMNVCGFAGGQIMER